MNYTGKIFYLLFLINFFFSFKGFARTFTQFQDSISNMTLDEKIGQLIILNNKSLPQNIVNQQLRDNNLSGILFENIENISQLDQIKSKIPLFLGLNQQPKDLPNFESLCAIYDEKLKKNATNILSNYYASKGLNLCFIPFYDSTKLFAKKQIVEIFAENKILSIAQQVDYQEFNLDSLKKIDLYGIKTLSPNQKNNFLKSKKSPKILVFSEIENYHAINEKTVLNWWKNGTNIFILENRVDEFHMVFKKLISENKIKISELDSQVNLILKLKNKLYDKEWKELNNINFSSEIKYKISEESINILQNKNQVLPLTGQDYIFYSIGDKNLNEFYEITKKYSNFISKHFGQKELLRLNLASLTANQQLIFIINNLELDQEFDAKIIQEIQKFSNSNKFVLVNIGAIQNQKYFSDLPCFVQVSDQNKSTQNRLAQLLFGGITYKRNKISKNKIIEEKKSFENQNYFIKKTRLKYCLPEELGIDSEKLSILDSIANAGIEAEAMPGCQILVAKNGKVFYQKSFGFHTYEKKRAVQNTDLYDIASITKVIATTLAVMNLYEEGKIQLTDSLKNFFEPEYKTTTQNIKLQDLLTHRSGLQAFMPIWDYLTDVDSIHLRYDKYFCNTKNSDFSLEICEHIYLRKDYQDSIWKSMNQLELKRRKKYKYSDVNFNILQKVVEQQNQESLDKSLAKLFFEPLNLQFTYYRPLEHFSKIQIVPTENDTIWRKKLLHGYVHDYSAALFGGVAGNAGIFSNANDLAIIFQMLLNKGNYGGIQFFEAETVDLFTKKQANSHRGLGFDKPNPKRKKPYSYTKSASLSSFGHTGFTGTCVWADPENDLIFVFLSNRIHPDMNNKKLNKLKIRAALHAEIYKLIKN